MVKVIFGYLEGQKKDDRIGNRIRTISLDYCSDHATLILYLYLYLYISDKNNFSNLPFERMYKIEY